MMITRKLGRRLDHRGSMIKNLATSLVLYEKLTTTTPKAKEIRSVAERWINIGKQGGLKSYRSLLAMVKDPKAAKKIIEELSWRYKNVTGGYVVLTKASPRLGDAALMSVVELRSIKSTEQEHSERQETTKKVSVEKSIKGVNRKQQSVKEAVKPPKARVPKKSRQ